VSFVLACAATLTVRRAHLASRGKAARRKWRLMHRLRPAVGNSPMLWKELFAEPAASRLGWVGRIALALIVLGVIVPTFYIFFGTLTTYNSYQRVAEQYIGYALTMGTLLGCGGLLLVASRAAGSITSEKERDCWTSLVSTPLEPGEIVWAKIAGSLWSLRGMVLLLLLIWGLGAALDPKFLVAIPFLLGMFVLLAFYAAALGVRYSLRCRSSMRAMAATLATGLFVGGMYLFCCMPVMIAGGGGRGPDHAAWLMATPCVPFLLAFPGSVYMYGDQFLRSDEGGVMIFACFLGTIGYLAAAIILAASGISRFDALSGRTGPMQQPQRRPLPKPLPESPAQAIVASPSDL
jgi:hypothetical protein